MDFTIIGVKVRGFLNDILWRAGYLPVKDIESCLEDLRLLRKSREQDRVLITDLAKHNREMNLEIGELKRELVAKTAQILKLRGVG